MRTDLHRKLAALMKLAAARQATFAELAQQVYLEALESTDVGTVETACAQLAREPRDEFASAFPSLGDILQECRYVRAEAHRVDLARLEAAQPQQPTPEPLSRLEAKEFIDRLRADVERARRGEPLRRDYLRSHDVHEPTYHCLVCKDDPYNWEPLQCAGVGMAPREWLVPIVPCDRPFAHAPHSYVVPCSCAATNPVSRLARERIAEARRVRRTATGRA